MDKKHREYCIKLGNPFMMEEDHYQNKEERKVSSWEGFEIDLEDNSSDDQNWLKNTQKFTN